MNYKKKTICDIDVAGKRCLVRCDFNVPTDERGNIEDDSRVVKTLPTIQYLLDHGASVILCSHIGRPKFGYEEKYSLKAVWLRLEELLNRNIYFLSEAVGSRAQIVASRLRPGEIMLLENVRFVFGETENKDTVAKAYASLADLFVNDAFGSSHRAHASTAGVANYLPAVSGLLVKKELEVMGQVMENPRHPFVLIVGGSKVSDKIGVIDYLLDKADHILIGGGMSYTFTKALGGSIGNSLCEAESFEYCRKLLEKARAKGVQVHLPKDNVIADRYDPEAKKAVCPDGQIPAGRMGLDIGPETISEYTKVIAGAGTVVWNGPMGVFEWPRFAFGTQQIAKAMAESDALTVIGGGDSAAAAEQFGFSDRITHISTGGGASLEFFAGHELPGVACLLDA